MLTSREVPIKTGWRNAPLAFCNLAKTFKQSTIYDSNGIQTHNHLVCKRTLNHFAKLVKWLTCVVSTILYSIHLNFRYCTCFEEGVPWHSENYRVYIHSEMHTWYDNNIKSLHCPGSIKIVTARIHYWYCYIIIVIITLVLLLLMTYGK